MNCIHMLLLLDKISIRTRMELRTEKLYIANLEKFVYGRAGIMPIDKWLWEKLEENEYIVFDYNNIAYWFYCEVCL